MNFNKFVQNTNNYSEFATAVNSSDNKIKGDISEEYWRRWFHFVPHISGYKKIYNANDKSCAKLLHKWPELSVLKIGKPNSALVDLVIEYDNDYDLVSCKWWNDGLDLKEIGTYFAVTNQHFPNLRTKYLTTTAPRTSAIAVDLANTGKDVVVMYEEEFCLDDDEDNFIWDQIKNWKDGNKPNFKKWFWRNKREEESYKKIARAIKRSPYNRSWFQAPPGWGKTHLMFMLDKHFWKKNGGITVNMADGSTVVRQNFEHFNKQYRAHGIYRPSLVICSGAEDDNFVNWPVEVVGHDAAKILNWIQHNPNGMIFCFYGNTKFLEQAIQAHISQNPNFKVTFASCDEASRTCQQVGSGWSHIVYDSLIPIQHRFFCDATPKVGKKIGMDNEKLYGFRGDQVTQPEAEAWGSVTGYFVKGLVFNQPALKQWFHERRNVKGKTYTVEDYCMAMSVLFEKAEDPNDHHTVSFGLTIDRLNTLRRAFEDARNAIIKQYPKNKKYQALNDVELFVADTHIHTTNDIHNKLGNIYETKNRSIVFTSRLLYRGWSQVKLDSVHFSDNFKGTSYLVQSLGRGLRKNEAKKDKICKIMIPTDLQNSEPWNHLLGLIDNLKKWDYRPMEAILALLKKSRNKSQRKPVSGGVYLTVNGVPMNASHMKGLKNVLVTHFNQWQEWCEWHELAKDYLAKMETFEHLFRHRGKGIGYAQQKVLDEILLNQRYETLVSNGYKNIKQGTMYQWVYRHIVRKGSNGVNNLNEWILFKSKILDVKDTNESTIQTLTKQWFDDTQSVRRKFKLASQEKVGYQYKEMWDELEKTCPEEIKKYYPHTSKNQWVVKIRDIAFGAKNRSIDRDYVEAEIKKTEGIIEEAKVVYAEKVTKWCIDYHRATYTPLVKIKKYATEFFGDCLTTPRWNGWIVDQEHANEYTDEWFSLAKTPAVEPGRPLCIRCGCKGAEKRWHKNYTDWHKNCSACIRLNYMEKEKA